MTIYTLTQRDHVDESSVLGSRLQVVDDAGAQGEGNRLATTTPRTAAAGTPSRQRRQDDAVVMFIMAAVSLHIDSTEPGSASAKMHHVPLAMLRSHGRSRLLEVAPGFSGPSEGVPLVMNSKLTQLSAGQQLMSEDEFAIRVQQALRGDRANERTAPLIGSRFVQALGDVLFAGTSPHRFTAPDVRCVQHTHTP